ncbi:MAG: hypothetical protein IPN42_12925 [Methylococcaceae bacterium]|nr:hypothetical protein [Methylococcaceae bacterium]
MRIRLCMLAILLIITFTSSAFGAKLSHHKRKALYSGRNSFNLQLGDRKADELEALFFFDSNGGVEQRLQTQTEEPLSFLNLCKKSDKYRQNNEGEMEKNVQKGLNEVPIPNAALLFVSGFLVIFNKKAKWLKMPLSIIDEKSSELI